MLSNIASGAASKFVVAALGTVASALATYYTGTHYVPVVTEILTALAVYLVPNEATPKGGSNDNVPIA